ncbi:hypothetical protein [Candidatus Solirubrobacter pratensis]|uniref:hypothetical protein n=1 Tax=Candidatus Solirubrobacter pratensis TaxID=1298857 RepID=UPI00041DB899|nr:hypothetical protein [Candidatus Solirubrobacter pratensis]
MPEAAPTPSIVESIFSGAIAEIDAKMEERRPAYEEFLELQDAKSRLTGTSARPRAAARTSTATSGTTRSTGTRRRAPGQPDRKGQFLAVLAERGSATIPEIAKAIDDDVSPNYLYRVRDTSLKDGLIEPDGNGFKITAKGRSEHENPGSAGEEQAAA